MCYTCVTGISNPPEKGSRLATFQLTIKIQNYDKETDFTQQYDNCAWKPSACSVSAYFKQYDNQCAWNPLHIVSALFREQYENWQRILQEFRA